MRSTPWKARRDAPPSTTTSPDISRSGAGRAAPRRAADAKTAVVAERQRHHRRVEILLVGILVKAELCPRRIVVDEAGLGRMRVARHRLPHRQDHVGDRRPWPAGHGMGRLVAVAAVAVGDPAERRRNWSSARRRACPCAASSACRTAPPPSRRGSRRLPHAAPPRSRAGDAGSRAGRARERTGRPCRPS